MPARRANVSDYTVAVAKAVQELPAADDYLTCQTAAQRLGVPTWTILVAITKKRLPAFKMGRNWRIQEADLAAYERRYGKG
jgi:excisionase family DNA binding protein